jgi:hypothetical protein
MPAIIAMFWGALLSLVGSLVGRVMIALGISVVTFTGSNAALGWLKSQAVSALAGSGATVLGMLGTLQVGNCISLVFSAMVARQLMSGLTSDSVKRWVLK